MKAILLMAVLIACTNLFAIDYEIIKNCIKCHKEDGKSWVDEIPTLTGQNKVYLKNQINNFQTGKRKDTYLGRMPDIVRKLSPEDIEELTTHYSSLDPKDNYRSPRAMNEEQKRLYAIGSNYAPVCLGCHGLAETRPAERTEWPYISGQNQAAIHMQLRSFINETRSAPEMKFISKPPFNDPEVLEALSLYFSRQISPSPMNK